MGTELKGRVRLTFVLEKREIAGICWGASIRQELKAVCEVLESGARSLSE